LYSAIESEDTEALVASG